MNDQIDKQRGIVSRIIDGSVTIDSIAEIETLLNAFPNNPWIHRIFADLLKRDKLFYAAADEYGTTAKLFIEADMTLQAIVSKIFEWRILKPCDHEGKAFYLSLREGRYKNTGVQNFFIKMKYPEMISFMSELEPRHFPAGSMMKRFGDEENNLYFVVSGALEKTIYHRLKKGGRVQIKSSKELVKNDFFGDIYPFEEEKISQSTIETLTRVEFAKISKSKLMTICRKYPNVKLLVKGLYKTRSESTEEEFSLTVRRTVRHQLPTQVNIKIFKDKLCKAPLDFSGFTENVSLGGASVVLGENYKTGQFDTLAGKNVKLQIYLPIEFVSLSILGTIVWSKEVPLEGKTTAIVGIQFKGMTSADRRLLQGYNCGSESEQNLIWSLWDSLMEKQPLILDDKESNKRSA
jgi:CRP-like cAMP-binding protein